MGEKLREIKLLSVIICLGLGGISIVLFIIAGTISNSTWNNILNNIASVLLVSGIVSIINEYVLRNQLIDTIYNKTGLKEDINKAGLAKIFLDINKVDYEKFFEKKCTQIDIVHVYGKSWTSKHLKMFTEKLKKEKCKIRVFLVSPDSEFIKPLSTFYNVSEEELKTNMNSVIKMWKEINEKGNKGIVEVYYHKGNPTASFYKANNSIIIVNSSMAAGRDLLPPAFLYTKSDKGNEAIFDWATKQIERLLETSEIINLKE